jgi:hypothetical protein
MEVHGRRLSSAEREASGEAWYWRIGVLDGACLPSGRVFEVMIRKGMPTWIERFANDGGSKRQRCSCGFAFGLEFQGQHGQQGWYWITHPSV